MRANVVISFLASFLLFVCGCKDNVDDTVELPDSSRPLTYTITNICGSVSLDITGRIQAIGEKELSHKAGILLVRFLDRHGKNLGSGELTFSKRFGCGYKYLAAASEAQPFLCRVTVPSGAVEAEIRIARFLSKWRLHMSSFKYDVTFPPHAPKFQMQIVSIWFLMFVAAVFCCISVCRGFSLLFFWRRVAHSMLSLAICRLCLLV